MIPTLDTTASEIYRQHIQPLSRTERLHLLSLIAQELAQEATDKPPERSILELHGLGKDRWQGLDAQEYVNRLRQEAKL
jgi:hypothetical protein